MKGLSIRLLYSAQNYPKKEATFRQPLSTLIHYDLGLAAACLAGLAGGLGSGLGLPFTNS